MGSVHQGPVNNKGNELEVAEAELLRALSRVVKAKLGEEACFAEREKAALAACDKALAEIHREQQGSDEET